MPLFSRFKQPVKPTIALVTTGGTIVQKFDPKSGGAIPGLSVEDLLKSIPGLEEMAEIIVSPVSNIDSKDMDFNIYSKLAHKLIKLNADSKIDGVIILHGTDTMEETAFFLNHILVVSKPTVITGAMRIATENDADGPRNLMDAMRVMMSPMADNGNIMVIMNGNIINGNAVSKVDSSNVEAFNGGKHGVLGIVDEFHVSWYNRPIGATIFPIPVHYPKVDIILAYPGADGSLIKAAVENGAKGIVIVGYGAGNVSKRFFRKIKSIIHNYEDVVFLIETRSQEGNVLPVYAGEGGAVDLEKLGVILGGPINATKSRILLTLCIASKYTYKKINSTFQLSETF